MSAGGFSCSFEQIAFVASKSRSRISIKMQYIQTGALPKLPDCKAFQNLFLLITQRELFLVSWVLVLTQQLISGRRTETESDP